MPYEINAIPVMVAGPGDAREERELVARVIHRWNATNAKSRKCVILPLMWETHSVPDLSRPAQEQINAHVLADSDIVIAIFKSKPGTPYANFPGTTLYEIDTQVRAGKGAMVYFHRNLPLDGTTDDERARLAQIKEACRQLGRYGEYDSAEELAANLREDLDMHIQYSAKLSGLLHSAPAGFGMPTVGHVPAGSTLSKQARALLFAAAERVGNFMRSRGFQGTVYQAGDTVLCDGSSNREGVRWDAGLKELEDRELVTAGPQRRVFNLTDAGYKLAQTMGAKVPDDGE